MSTTNPSLNCVICTGFSIPSSSSSSSTSTVDDKLVIFFLQKFLKYPLLPPSSLSLIINEEETTPPDDDIHDKSSKEFLDDFIKSYGTPTEWIWFCPSCLPTIQEARDLHKRIVRIESKLNTLRNKVETKVVESFETDGEKVSKENENVVFQSVREKVFKRKWDQPANQNAADMDDDDYKIKEEYSSGMEDFGDDEVTPYFVNLDSMSPGYPVIYPNVKLEIEEQMDNFEDSGAIDPTNTNLKSSSKSLVEDNVADDVRETIYERRSRRQVKRQKIIKKKTKAELKEEDLKSVMSDNSVASGEDLEEKTVDENVVEGDDNTGELRETNYERRPRRKVKYEEVDEKSDSDEDEDAKSVISIMSDNSFEVKDDESSESVSDSGDSEYDPSPRALKKDLKSKPKRKPKAAKAPKQKKLKRLIKPPRKNDGRGGHRIKSSVECRTCPVCNQVFGCHSKMSVHLNVKHLRNVLYNCSVCKKGFMRKDYLRVHMEIHLPEEDRLLKQALRELKGPDKAEVKTKEDAASLESRTCQTCGKVFDNLSILKIHVECVHNNTMAYECHVCQKKFKWKDLLKKHMILHRDGEAKPKSVIGATVTPAAPLARTFECSFEGCKAAFRRKRDLEVHYRIHSGAKDFLCALCGISFRHEWSFRRHNILRHQAPESKKYQCDSCGKTFKIKWLLDQHLMSKSHGGKGLPKRTRRKGKDKEKEPVNPDSSKVATPERTQMVASASSAAAAATTTTSVIVPTASNIMNMSERSMDNSVVTAVDNYNSGESQSPIDHSQQAHSHHRRYDSPHMQQYYQQNFRPDLLNLLPHSRDIINYSNFGGSNAFGNFGYNNVPSNDSQSQ